MFGDIVKVTPSSKVVGDMALMMVSQGLTRAEVEDPKRDISFPDSVIDMMKGNLGQPAGRLSRGHPEEGAQGREAARPTARASTCPPSTWKRRARELDGRFEGMSSSTTRI